MMTSRTRLTTVAAIALALAAIPLAARSAHAQTHPAPAQLQRPVATPLLPDGAYELTMTPAASDAHAFTNAAPFQVEAQVVHAGLETVMTTSDSITLRGASSAMHLKASGPVHGAMLTLEVGGSGTQASGTWLLRGKTDHQLTGTVTIAPAPRYQTHTSKQGGCSGFFDCVSQITGYVMKTVFG